MAGRFSVEAVFKAVDRITAPVTRMQNRVGRFSRSMEGGFRRLNRSVDGFARGMRTAGLAVTAALALSSGAMASVIGTGAEFEQTLVSAAVKFPGEIRKGTEAFRLLEDAARETGSTTEFTASQAAGALNFLAMAGFNAESAVAALPGVVDLATSAGLDLATATDVASDSLGAFGLMTEDAADLSRNLARVNDVLAKTTTTSNTTVETMFNTIRDGAPVATAAGASIETFSALVGELANSGIKGGKAGTTLRAVFTRLQAPTGEAASVLNRLGIQTRDAGGNMLDVIDILEDFTSATDDMGTSQRAAALKAVFGEEALSGVNVLLNSGSERLREYRAQLEAAGGASSTMADVMRDTVQGRLDSLKSAIEGVSISLFTMSSGPLSDAIERTTEWVRANEEVIASNLGGWIAKIIDNFQSIVTWVKRIAIGIGIFLAFSVVLKTFIAIMTAVNLVMALNPITLIVLGVVALTVALVALGVYLWSIRDKFIALGKAIVDKVIAGVTWLKDTFLGLPGPVQAAIALITGPIGMLAAAGTLITENWEGITDFFTDLWGGVTATFEGALSSITDIADKVKNVASGIVDRISSIGGGVASFFGFGDDEEEGQRSGATGPQVVSPQERTARSIEETRTSSAAEVTIRDDTGRAEVTSGFMGPGVSLQPSGGF